MRLEETYTSWQDKHLTQEEPARMLRVCVNEQSGATLADMRRRDLAGITTMTEANDFLRNDFWLQFHATFLVPAPESGSAFVTLLKRR